MDRHVPREFWIVALVFCSVVGVLAIAVAFGGLSPRAFAVVAVLLTLFPFLRYWRLFQVAAKNGPAVEAPRTRRQAERKIFTLKARIVVCVLLGGLALWETRSGPLAPRMVGSFMLLALAGGSITELRRTKQALEQMNSGE